LLVIKAKQTAPIISTRLMLFAALGTMAPSLALVFATGRIIQV
jgi:hypothetical protein